MVQEAYSIGAFTKLSKAQITESGVRERKGRSQKSMELDDLRDESLSLKNQIGREYKPR